MKTVPAKKSRSTVNFAKFIRQPAEKTVLAQFFECPAGHALPHRVKGKGRCAPFDCCLAKGGAWGVVRTEDKANHAEALAYAEETAELLERRDRMRAWNDAHALPSLPAPPKSETMAAYIEKRLEQAAPIALERRIRRMMLDPGHEGEAAARELLNRGGFTERPEMKLSFNGPVLIVGSAAEIAARSPYAVQGKSQSPRSLEITDGQVVRRSADDSEGDASEAVEVESVAD